MGARRPLVLPVFLAALMAVAGCSADGTRDTPEAAVAASGQPTASASAPASGRPSGGLSDTDAAWLQLAAPTHDSMLRLFQLARERSRDPGVQRLVVRGEPALREELGKLRVAGGKAGLPGRNVHEGHNMPGMVTGEEFEAVRNSGRATFDRLFIGHVREYLERTAAIARSEADNGSARPVRELARDIVTARSAELKVLEREFPE